MKHFLRIFLVLSFIISFIIYKMTYYFEDKTVNLHLSRSGIGNQLFVYSSAHNLAKSKNYKLVIYTHEDFLQNDNLKPSDRKFALKNFDGQYEIRKIDFTYRILRNFISLTRNIEFFSEFFNFKVITEENYFDNIFNNNIPTRIFLKGYFESDIFFENTKDEIVKMFDSSKFISEENFDLKNKLESESAICVHVRRGDFSKNMLVGKFFYQKAFEFLESKIKNPKKYIFTDSVDYVKDEFKNFDDLIFIQDLGKFTVLEEFALMSKCRNIVTANSTFSWWAAYLNQEDKNFIISPYPRYDNIFVENLGNEELRRIFRNLKDNLYPSDWIKINRKTGQFVK